MRLFGYSVRQPREEVELTFAVRRLAVAELEEVRVPVGVLGLCLDLFVGAVVGEVGDRVLAVDERIDGGQPVTGHQGADLVLHDELVGGGVELLGRHVLGVVDGHLGIGRPRRPPLPLMVSTANSMPSCMLWPSAAAHPVSGSGQPSLIGSPVGVPPVELAVGSVVAARRQHTTDEGRRQPEGAGTVDELAAAHAAGPEIPARYSCRASQSLSVLPCVTRVIRMLLMPARRRCRDSVMRARDGRGGVSRRRSLRPGCRRCRCS